MHHLVNIYCSGLFCSGLFYSGIPGLAGRPGRVSPLTGPGYLGQPGNFAEFPVLLGGVHVPACQPRFQEQGFRSRASDQGAGPSTPARGAKCLKKGAPEYSRYAPAFRVTGGDDARFVTLKIGQQSQQIGLGNQGLVRRSSIFEGQKAITDSPSTNRAVQRRQTPAAMVPSRR